MSSAVMKRERDEVGGRNAFRWSGERWCRPMRIEMARIYDPPGRQMGMRVLVDRLWPRGIRKDAAPWDRWLKDVAPSGELRSWYHTHAEEVDEFDRRYRRELQEPVREAALDELLRIAETEGLILLTATKDVTLSQLPVLRAVLAERAGAS